jgi:hypothetical protein
MAIAVWPDWAISTGNSEIEMQHPGPASLTTPMDRLLSASQFRKQSK